MKESKNKELKVKKKKKKKRKEKKRKEKKKTKKKHPPTHTQQRRIILDIMLKKGRRSKDRNE